jgi:hypothetical protein
VVCFATKDHGHKLKRTASDQHAESAHVHLGPHALVEYIYQDDSLPHLLRILSSAPFE